MLAVAKELKAKKLSLKTVVVTERGGKFAHLLDGDSAIDGVKTISAGKLRRYHNQSALARLLDIKSNFLNIRDIFRMVFGLFQSIWFLLLHRPALIFIKGGYVGVPMGLAASLLRVPYVTHDSDALAGLTNRLIGRNAVINAVGMPTEFYSYPKEKMIFVGVPVGPDFARVIAKDELVNKKDLGIPSDGLVILVTGGSNGAQRLDKAVHSIVKDLLENNPKLYIIHQIGFGNENLYHDYPASLMDRIKVESFLRPLSKYSASADLIIARGGATAIAEFAVQGKATVIVPNPYLTGGHQLHNAEVLSQANSAVIITEDTALNSPDNFLRQVQELLDSPEQRQAMANRLSAMIPTDAGSRLADILVSQLEKNTKHG